MRKVTRVDMLPYLDLIGRAQTIFDLRPLVVDGGLTVATDGLAPRAAQALPGLSRARDNLLALCGRELGRFATATVSAHMAFYLTMLARKPGATATAHRLAARFEIRCAGHLAAIDAGSRDSLPAWRFLGLLYALDPGLDTSLEPEVLAPYRVCRDLIALDLEARPKSGPVAPLHLLGLLAFAELFAVFRLDFIALTRLLDRHGRPLAPAGLDMHAPPSTWLPAAAPVTTARPH